MAVATAARSLWCTLTTSMGIVAASAVQEANAPHNGRMAGCSRLLAGVPLGGADASTVATATKRHVHNADNHITVACAISKSPSPSRWVCS